MVLKKLINEIKKTDKIIDENKEPVKTTITPELKNFAKINGINFAEALEVGVRILLKRNEGINGLMSEEEEIKKKKLVLNKKLAIIRKEIKVLKEKEVEKDEFKKKEEERKFYTCPACGEYLKNKKSVKYKGKLYCKTSCVKVML